MSARWLPVLPVVFAACEPTPKTNVERAAAKVEGRPAPSGVEACIDRWLAEHQLDPYGSPAGTQYAGGTPLFDPATGASIPRVAYVMARHGAAAEACGAKGGETP